MPAVQLTDHASFQSWYADHYNNYRASPAWNPVGRVWEVAWLQEWAASTDDWDVYRRTYSPATAALGTVDHVNPTAAHRNLGWQMCSCV